MTAVHPQRSPKITTPPDDLHAGISSGKNKRMVTIPGGIVKFAAMKKIFMICGMAVILLAPWRSTAQESHTAPEKLSVNLLVHTGQVLLDGYLTELTPEEALQRREHFQWTEIGQKKPFFGWEVPGQHPGAYQSAFRILVASSPELLAAGTGDLWDSGKREDHRSVSVAYEGNPLEAGKVYFWKVMCWTTPGEASPWSENGRFLMARQLEEYATACYPLVKADDFPQEVKDLGEGSYFVDFGRAAFGRIRLTLFSPEGGDTFRLHLGEAYKNGRVNRQPGGSVRYSSCLLTLRKGWHTYTVLIPPDQRNTGPQAILMPDYTGEVTPFRGCEIEHYREPITPFQVVRESVTYPFDQEASRFSCSDSVLNRVWELSKYSIRATSFAGWYIDGDRERIPYEADALINQLSHYCVDREYSMARRTLEYLIFRPTWPTEWILQTVLMAWEDYLYTGNNDLLFRYYEDLKAKTLLALADERGFISTKTGRVTPEVLRSIHFNGTLRDIVDWPHPGILGLGKQTEGETDGFVFCEVNTVVNAYHYRSLDLMARIAGATGHDADSLRFAAQASRLKSSFNQFLFDRRRGVYRDGLGTDHASLHANMFPLAFGLVPPEDVSTVVEFIRSRGMACSVYGAQFLVDALYAAGEAGYGLELLTSTAGRSWYNMIRAGATITMEAWDNDYKPNQDWNHAWGAAPANLIPRRVMGIQPLEPGCSLIAIQPQPGNLRNAEILHPTIRGAVHLSFENNPGESFSMKAGIPANMTAEIRLPVVHPKQQIWHNGKVLKIRGQGKGIPPIRVASGEHLFEVR